MAKAKVNLESHPVQVVDLFARQHVLDSVPADAAEIPRVFYISSQTHPEQKVVQASAQCHIVFGEEP
jgi:hypothetical protein